MINSHFYICFNILFIYTACMIWEIGIISVNNGFCPFSCTLFKWNKTRALTSHIHIHGALLRGIKVQQFWSLISRKQQLECWSSLSLRGRLGPTAALISSVIILTVFAQPCWHISQVRQFCFRIFHNCLHTFSESLAHFFKTLNTKPLAKANTTYKTVLSLSKICFLHQNYTHTVIFLPYNKLMCSTQNTVNLISRFMPFIFSVFCCSQL